MKWMITIRLNPQEQAEITARLADEQAYVKTLMAQGTIEALYVAADQFHTWLVMQEESQLRLQQVVESLPLYAYMELEIVVLK